MRQYSFDHPRPTVNSSVLGRKVRITSSSKIVAWYFKKGQVAYVHGVTNDGGIEVIDRKIAEPTLPGEVAYLVADAKDSLENCHWLSAKAVKFVGRR